MSSSTIEVSEDRLRTNVGAIRTALGEATWGWAGAPAELLGVIKADGYGHSATLVAPMLTRAGVGWLGVTDAEEGAAVRAAVGWDGAKILVMSGPPGDMEGAREAARVAVREGLTPVVWRAGQLPPLAAAAARGGAALAIHLEIDSGMSRQGAGPGRELREFLEELGGHRALRLDGVFTHLASAERTDGRQTREQMRIFEAGVGEVAAAGERPGWVHIGNAATIDNGAPGAEWVVERLHRLADGVGATAMVRCGLALYGLTLPLEGEEVEEHGRLRGRLQPIATWRTTITSIVEVAAGAPVGYGAAYTAEEPMRLALLPVGYADGLRRGLSSTNAQPGGWVLVHGQRAPIVGRVSMNLTTVDVTRAVPPPRAGDAVTLLGDGVSAEDHARVTGALPYEILCGLRGKAVAAEVAGSLAPTPDVPVASRM